jgi:hypothetical protein
MRVTEGLVSGGSGSYGRSTWSHNRAGSYVRSRAIPVNTNTSQQQNVRNHLGNLAAFWQNGLTTAQRGAWENFAAAVPKTDKLGGQAFLTGQNWFIAANVLRLQGGKSQINDAPLIYTLASMTAPVISVNGSTSVISVAFTNTDAWAAAVGGHMFVFASRPVSVTVNFFAGPYRLAGVINGAVSPPTSPQTFASPFAMSTEQKQFYRVVVSEPDGRPSPAFRSSAFAT